jgi:hypothetical protein
MIESDDLDKRMYEQFFDKDGSLSVEVITGLQALSRDTDLQKLMQMGEMVRNLPEQAAASFKWEEYARSLITALGYDARNWVRSAEEVREEQMAMDAQKAQMQMQQQAGGVVANTAGNIMQQAASQDLASGGQNIMGLLQQAGIGGMGG